MKKIFLLNNKLIKKKNYNYYYLNKYHKPSKSKELYLPLYCDVSSKIIKIDKKTKQLYKKMVLIFKKFFNFSFDINYSTRDYEVLIGFFIINLCRIIIGRENKITYLIKKKNFKYFATSNSNYKNVFFYDTIDFIGNIVKNLPKNINLSEFITRELIKSFCHQDIKIIPHRHKVDRLKYIKEPKISNLEKIKNIFIKISCFFSYRDKDFILYNSFLNWKESFLVQIKLGQIPSFWKLDKAKQFSVNNSLRKNLYNTFINKMNLEAKDKKYFKIFHHLLPTCYLEGFQNNLNQSKKIKWSNKSKLLFTSNAFAFDETFRFWVFKNHFNNRTIIGQHGCNYGTAKYRINPAIEEVIYKYFLTWGWKNHKKNFKGFNFTKNLIFKKKIIDNQNVLLVLDNMRGEFLYDEIHNYENDISNNCKLVKILCSNYKNVIVKTHNNEGNFYNEKKILLNLNNKNLSVITNEKKLTDLINLNDLIFFTYDATDFFNCLISNRPCIVFLNRGFFNIKKKYHNIYKYLINVDVIITDYKKLNNHIISINKTGISKWWFSKNTQENIKKFNSKINVKSHNKTDDFSKILKKVKNLL